MKEIPKTYNPSEVEDKIYRRWEKSGFFNPDNLKLPKNAKPYTIILPPPNITDKLHMGHSAMLAIEDLLIRFHRMRGYRALWLPGTDHAAIATQNVVEKKLLKERGVTRHKLGKEKFLEEVWKFLKETQATILHQTRKMGSSLDWSREAFTLSEDKKKAVAEMFVRMYEAGLIYQGYRIVNWCPRCHSTLADDEIEYKEQDAMLYTFKYDKNFPFPIATTRPETKLGDTAVAVNPKDKRYKKYIGQTIEADFCGVKLKLKIIADRGVEADFGTGALGVTPAHSAIDWKMAEENSLPIVKVIGEDGNILQGFGKFSGHTAEEARGMIVEELRKCQLLEKDENMKNNLSTCYRCGASIEPLPSKQWFVSVEKKAKELGNKSLKEKALEAARTGKIKFIPGRFTKRYSDWMTNLHDWCISRQIWFGHEIPVWYRKAKTKLILVRHAQTDWNVKKIMQGQTDIPINRTGNQQAEELRELMRKEKVDVIIISPLKRTRQTAKIINTFGLPIIEDDRLKERGYGKFEGMKTEDLLRKHPEITTFEVGESLYWIDVPTAETYDEVRSRVREFIDEVKNKYPGKNVMIVSHGDTLDMFYAELNGVDNEKAYGKFSHNARVHEHEIDSRETYVSAKPPKSTGWEQDPDTLDTWFSSGMWTFSTLGWPDTSRNGKKTGDLKRFHPTQVLETGYDILTLWVSRMIMMSLFAVGEIPFENVYLHGLVLDKHGKKMSKSKGNGIDPLDMIDKFGADATRLSLLIGSTPGNDVRISEEKIEGFRNMVTKLWNIYRYAKQSSADFSLEERIKKSDIKSLSDRWILSRLAKLTEEVTGDFEQYQFSLSGEKLRDFTWNELADWYVETNKIEKNSKVLGYVLDKLLRLWHPFIPFVTEHIFESEKGSREFLLVAKWPTAEKHADKKAEKDFRELQELIGKIRNIRSIYHIDPQISIDVYTSRTSEREIIEKLARVSIASLGKEKGKMIKITSGKHIFNLDIVKLIDIEKELAGVKKEMANLENLIKKSQAMLKNDNFVKNAPQEVINGAREKLVEYEKRLSQGKDLSRSLVSLTKSGK